MLMPPPVVVSPPEPVTYIERAPEVEQAAQQAPAAGYWYWCGEPQGWYPQVPECPPGWQPVAPRPQE